MENNKNQPIRYFLDNMWPKHRSQLYRDLYNTYHPSAYVESFNRPGGNFEDALETVADAVHEGKKLGLLDSSVHWSDIYDYESRDRAATPGTPIDSEDFPHSGIDDDGIPTLHDKLEIIDNTNLDWVHAILLFDVYEEIVDEFKHYCGENGIDESGMGECMDEFPPDARGEMVNGTLKQDYYTLYNFMRELERAGVPVTDYLKDPTYPNIIKLVDDGSTDYDDAGSERTSADWENMRTQTEFEMDAPDRIYEHEEKKSILQKTMKDLKLQLKLVGTFGFGISGMFGMTKDLLEGRYPVLTETDITLIFLAAMVYMGVDLVDDVKKVFEMINDRGLKKYISKTVETLTDFKNVAFKIADKAGYAVSSLTELFGYTLLLMPILDGVTKLVNKEALDIVTLGTYLKTALLSIGVFYVRNIFNSIIHKLRGVKPVDNYPEETLEEAYINGKIVYNTYSDNKLITEELVGEMSLLDTSPTNKNLGWIVNEELKVNFINTNTVDTLGRFQRNKNFLLSRKHISNYTSILDLDIRLNKIVETDEKHNNIYMSKIAEKATTDVVKNIFEVITLFEGGEEYFILPDYYTDKDGDEYRYGELQFNVEVNIIEIEPRGLKEKEKFILDSTMGGEYEDTIYVDIILSPDFNEKDYESLQIVLSEYIRHEIEHILQTIDPNRPDIIDKDDTMSPFDYYTQQHEVDAQKVGFERRAKMENRPIDDVVRDYIEYRQSIDQLTDKEKKKLVDTLTK